MTTETALLVARGLGSCVAIGLWDPLSHAGGLSHVLLPSIEMSVFRDSPHKFADRSVPLMVRELRRKGAPVERLVAKIVGGAQMFNPKGLSHGGVLRIGERNVTAVREQLAAVGVPIVGEDVGGTVGRTVAFSTSDGSMTITTIESPPRIL